MKHLKRTVTLVAMMAVLSLGHASIARADTVQQTFTAPIVVVNTSFLNVRTGPSAQFGVLTTVVGGTELPVIGTAGDSVWYQVSTAVGVGWINIEFVIPRGDFSNVPLVAVDDPITTTTIITLPEVVTSTTTIPSVTTTSSTVPTTTTAVVPSNAILVRAAAGQNVNVYSQPTTSSGAITTLFANNTDQDYAILGSGFDGAVTFLLIDIPGVGQGYIDQSKAITRLARTTERDVLVVNTGVAALTIGPGGSNNGELPILTSGDEGYLANVSPDGNFVQLELVDGTRGWLPFSQVSQRTGTTTDINPIDVSSVSTVTTTSAVPGTTATGTIPVVIDTTLGQGGATGVQIIPATPVPIFSQNVIVVNTSALNVRSGPGAQFTTLFTAAGGSQFDVVGLASDGVWFLISGPFGQGWVNNEFVIFRGNIEEVPLIRNATGVIATPIAVIGTSAQLYAAPGTNFGLLGSIVGPVEAPIVARTAEFDWVQINTSAGFGWVLASSVTIRGDVSIIPIVAN